MIRLLTACALILSATGSAGAQTVVDQRAWLTVTMQGSVAQHSPWRWSFDAIVRSRDGVSALDVASLRPALYYTLTSHSTLGGGYGFVLSYPAGGGVMTEHRIYGVYTWNHPAGGGTVSVRVRLEDRLIEGNSGPLWRFRPQVRFMCPIRSGSRLSLVAWEELNLHLNTTTLRPRGVDQNRYFTGVAIAWSPRLRIEAGYLNQYIPGHGAANGMNHIVSSTLAMTF